MLTRALAFALRAKRGLEALESVSPRRRHAGHHPRSLCARAAWRKMRRSEPL